MKVHDEKWHTENFMWGNSRERRKGFWTDEIATDWAETLDTMRTRLISCYNCPMTCGATITPPGKPTYMMKCFSKLTYTMAAFSDLEFGLGIAQSATEYGLDGFSTPQVMAFALELLDAGILSQDDFPDMPEDNEGRFYYLLEKIVNREGIGDKLANGTYWAAKEIGNGAEEYAHNTIKKHEQLPLKLSMLNPIYFLMYATGEKINITQIEGQFPQAPFPKREHREKFVEDWYQVPDDRFKQYFLDWEPRGDNSIPYYPTPEMCCDIVDWQERMHYIDDALGMCAGLSSFPLKPPYHLHNYPKFISSGAGYEMDMESLSKAAKRYRTLVRAINNRRGMRRKDDAPPANHWKKRFPELEKELLDTYYTFKGWNEDGIPTKESLHELGLDYVADDFIARGILKDGEDAPSNATPAADEKEA
jgi:benzoyl-CoA reductase subunit BamB